MDKEIVITQEQQFAEIVGIIQKNRCAASMAVNEAVLFTAWQVGSYVSHKLKSEEWGSKVVTQLSEFIRSHYPDIKGYSRSSIYNMVMFYDEYSSDSFLTIVKKYMSLQFVQMSFGQMPDILKLTSLSNH